MTGKAVISNRIYLSEPDGGFDEIKKKLTYRLETKFYAKGAAQKAIEIIRNYKILPRNVLSIPQGRTDLIPEGYEIIDKRVEVDMPFPLPKLPLREEQQSVYDDVEESCFINALVGWGSLKFCPLYK